MRCPTCGNETNPFGGSPTSQQEWYSRQMAQQQNMNQLGWGQGSMQGVHHPAAGTQNAYRPPIEPEPSEPAPPKPMSAWQQFKALIHEVFP